MKITGLSDVLSALNEMPVKIQKNVVGAGTQGVATLVVKKARTNAFRHGGGLASHAKDIVVRKTPGKNERLVGFKKGISRLAHLFEFGTAERVQETTGRRTGRIPMQPFLRPAVEQTSPQQAEDAFVKASARRFEREMKKLDR